MIYMDRITATLEVEREVKAVKKRKTFQKKKLQSIHSRCENKMFFCESSAIYGEKSVTGTGEMKRKISFHHKVREIWSHHLMYECEHENDSEINVSAMGVEREDVTK